MRPPIVLVANPTAHTGRAGPLIARARALLDHAGLAHVLLATLPGGATVPALAELLRDRSIDTVVAMGGDGTFAEAAKGILASGRGEQVRLAMLPTGTANNQGQCFDMDAHEDALPTNVEVIREGFEVRLDAGAIDTLDETGVRVRGDWFFNNASWGISARVLALRDRERATVETIPLVREIVRDRLVYAGALLVTFLRSYVEDQKLDAKVVADGRTVEWQGLTDLLVSATKVFGGLWIVDPTSRHDDGLFEVVPFFGRRDLLAKSLVHLEHGGRLVEGAQQLGVGAGPIVRARHIELTLSPHPGGQPMFAQIDGEESPPGTRVRIEVHPRALRLIVPNRSTDRDATLRRTPSCSSTRPATRTTGWPQESSNVLDRGPVAVSIPKTGAHPPIGNAIVRGARRR